MAREDPTIYMRIPAHLKSGLDEAAKVAGRSLTAEVVARLESTFRPSLGEEQSALEAETRILTAKAQMLALRGDLLSSRLEALYMRSRLVQVESEKLTREAKTDEDFQQAEESFGQLRAIEKQATRLGNELEAVLREREEMVALFDSLGTTLEQRRLAIEAGMVEYLRRNPDSKHHATEPASQGEMPPPSERGGQDEGRQMGEPIVDKASRLRAGLRNARKRAQE